jgi:hypothetical protein
MDDSIIDEFKTLCMNNNLEHAKELYNKNKDIININEITGDEQGIYNIFEIMCIKKHINIVEWFVEIGILSKHYNDGFVSACQYNNIDIAIYLNDNFNGIQLEYQTAFLICCFQGNFELIKWLYIIAADVIDIHVCNETPFLYTITQNHFDIAKWIYHISIGTDKIIDIYADDNYAFISACYNGRLDICQWLYLISNNTIDKHMNNDKPLQNALLSGNQDLIVWLKN